MTLTKNHSTISKQSTKINKAFQSGSTNTSKLNDISFNTTKDIPGAFSQASEPEVLELNNEKLHDVVGTGGVKPEDINTDNLTNNNYKEFVDTMRKANDPKVFIEEMTKLVENIKNFDFEKFIKDLAEEFTERKPAVPAGLSTPHIDNNGSVQFDPATVGTKPIDITDIPQTPPSIKPNTFESNPVGTKPVSPERVKEILSGDSGIMDGGPMIDPKVLRNQNSQNFKDNAITNPKDNYK